MARKSLDKPPNHLRAWREFKRLGQSQVAEQLRIDRNTVYRLEMGQRRLTEGWLNRFAAIYGCEPRDLLGPPEPAAAQAEAPRPAVQLPALEPLYAGFDLPVRGPAKASLLGRPKLQRGEEKPLEVVGRPAELVGVDDAYAVYIVGSSMRPRYYEGERAYIHPHKPLKRGDDVIIIQTTGEYFIKELVSIDEAGVVARDMQANRIKYPAATVEAVHRVLLASRERE